MTLALKTAEYARTETGTLIRQGSWTLLANLGTKVQAVCMLAAGGLLSGPAGVGTAATLYGAGVLASSMADFGFSSESYRSLAAVPQLSNLKRIRSQAVWRGCMAAVLGMLLVMAQGFVSGKISPFAVIVLVGILSLALFAQATASAVMFGVGLFRRASVGAGLFRLLLAPGFVVGAKLTDSSISTVLWMALSEIIVACILVYSLRHVRTLVSDEDCQSLSRPLSSFYWLGIGTLINVLINRSDPFLISLVASPTAVGIYAIASTIENGVSTIALAPSASLPRHVAQALSNSSNPKSQVMMVSRAVGLLAFSGSCVVAGGVAIVVFTPSWTVLHDNSATPILLCLAGAPMAAVAGSLLGALVGLGDHRVVAGSWLLVAIPALPAMAILAYLFSATGAAVGAVVRDGFLLIVSAAVWRLLSRRRTFDGLLESS